MLGAADTVQRDGRGGGGLRGGEQRKGLGAPVQHGAEEEDPEDQSRDEEVQYPVGRGEERAEDVQVEDGHPEQAGVRVRQPAGRL